MLHPFFVWFKKSLPAPNVVTVLLSIIFQKLYCFAFHTGLRYAWNWFLHVLCSRLFFPIISSCPSTIHGKIHPSPHRFVGTLCHKSGVHASMDRSVWMVNRQEGRIWHDGPVSLDAAELTVRPEPHPSLILSRPHSPVDTSSSSRIASDGSWPGASTSGGPILAGGGDSE